MCNNLAKFEISFLTSYRNIVIHYVFVISLALLEMSCFAYVQHYSANLSFSYFSSLSNVETNLNIGSSTKSNVCLLHVQFAYIKNLHRLCLVSTMIYLAHIDSQV